MQLTNNLGYLLQHLASVLARQSDQVLLERLGIGFSQFKLLMVLQWNPHIQQKQIADSLGQTEASISRQIKLMLEKGLLHIEISPQNRREHITTTTPKGMKLTEEARRILAEYHAPVFSRLSEKQISQMIESLTMLHAEVCQSGRIGACHHPLNI